MKKIAINVISFGIIFAILIIANHITITTTRYENKVWHGTGIVTATWIKTETKLIGGQIVKEESHDVEWFEGLGSFLTSDTHSKGSTTIAFR